MPLQTTKTKILAFAGSTRTQSWNQILLKIAAKEFDSQTTDLTLIDLRDFPLPLYDGDFEKEHGIPTRALKLRDLFLENQGLLIAAPEYNSSITGVLKNTLDWVSRPREGEVDLACFKKKTVALISTSTGALGGIRGLVHLRSMLENIGVIVIPDQVCVPKAETAFNGDSSLKDEKLYKKLKEQIPKFVSIVQKLNKD